MKHIQIEDTSKKMSKRKIIIIVAIVIIIVALVSIIITYVLNSEFRNWIDINVLRKELEQTDVATIEFNSDANVEICAYDKYIGILSKNEFTIYNSSGKEERTLDVPINNVLFDAGGRFLVIAENEGQKAYLISSQNIAWENSIEGAISKVSVNKNGYTAVVISNTSYKTVVSLYDPNGKELFKIYLSSTRVADVSISNDNKYLALAEIDTSSSVIQSNVKIVSVEDAQTNPDNSFYYIYNAESNKLLTSIKYQDKNSLVCMYDNSVDVIKDNENTQIINLDDRKATFLSIETNNNVALVEEKTSGIFTADSEVALIDVATQRENTYVIEDVTKEIYASSSVIGLNLGSEIHFIDLNGWLIKKYTAGQEISKVILSDSLAGIIYRDKIEIINF